MSPTCSRIRQNLIGTLPDSADLHGSKAAQAHLAECAACSLWWRRQVLWVQSLNRRLQVPAELEARVALCAEPTSRRERALAAVEALEALPAPAQLEALVARDLGTPVTRALGRLETRRAPDVLERLVTEELADPAASAVRRQVGGLARVDAPLELERTARRLAASGPRIPRDARTSRFWSHPVRAGVALAAAAVIAWVAVPTGLLREQQPSERTWSFEIASATLDSGLNDVGLGLLEGLTGGVAGAAREAEDR